MQENDSLEKTKLSSELECTLPDLDLSPEPVSTPTKVQPRRITVRGELTDISSPHLLANANVEEVVVAATSKVAQPTRTAAPNAPNTPYRSKLRSSKKNPLN